MIIVKNIRIHQPDVIKSKCAILKEKTAQIWKDSKVTFPHPLKKQSSYTDPGT